MHYNAFALTSKSSHLDSSLVSKLGSVGQWCVSAFARSKLHYEKLVASLLIHYYPNPYPEFSVVHK